MVLGSNGKELETKRVACFGRRKVEIIVAPWSGETSEKALERRNKKRRCWKANLAKDGPVGVALADAIIRRCFSVPLFTTPDSKTLRLPTVLIAVRQSMLARLPRADEPSEIAGPMVCSAIQSLIAAEDTGLAHYKFLQHITSPRWIAENGVRLP
jgi:hypothetical protein